MQGKIRRIDFVQGKPAAVLWAVCAPLIVVNVVQIFTSFLVNALYSRYMGQDYFAVRGYLSTVLDFYGTFVNGIGSAAWIRTAQFYVTEDTEQTQQQLSQAVYAVVLGFTAFTLLLLLLRGWIFQLLYIPGDIYEQAELFYNIYLISYLPVCLMNFFMYVLTGTGSTRRILIVNLLTVILSVGNTVLLLPVLRLGLVGGALLTACNGAVQLVLIGIILYRDGLLWIRSWNVLRVSGKRIRSIVSYGLLLSFQGVLCNIGYLIVTAQTNRYLSLDYVSVLQVMLPLSGVMSAISQACSAFYPQNYGTEDSGRVKRFFALSTSGCMLYGGLCFCVFWATARWYYGELFSDPQIVAYGVQYWFWYGVGFIPLSCLYTVRTFFDAVGMGKISLLAGIGELVGNLLCAFWLIPQMGNIGRSLSYPIGWTLSAGILLTAYVLCRKKIYSAANRSLQLV